MSSHWHWRSSYGGYASGGPSGLILLSGYQWQAREQAKWEYRYHSYSLQASRPEPLAPLAQDFGACGAFMSAL